MLPELGTEALPIVFASLATLLLAVLRQLWTQTKTVAEDNTKTNTLISDLNAQLMRAKVTIALLRRELRIAHAKIEKYEERIARYRAYILKNRPAPLHGDEVKTE